MTRAEHQNRPAQHGSDGGESAHIVHWDKIDPREGDDPVRTADMPVRSTFGHVSRISNEPLVLTVLCEVTK